MDVRSVLRCVISRVFDALMCKFYIYVAFGIIIE